MRLLVSLALTCVVGCSTAPQIVAVPSTPTSEAVPSQYTVIGTATIAALPDLAELVVVLSSERTRPRDAAASVRDSQAALMAALTAAGVTQSDIAVSRLQIDAVHELIDPRGAKMRLRGYDAALTITITTRDFDRLPELMDIAASSGATSLSSRLRVSDLPAIKQRAREEAAKMARSKAESMAGLLGVDLGRIRAISESDGGGMGNFYANRLDNDYQPADPSAGAHGEAEEITVSVSVTYDLG